MARIDREPRTITEKRQKWCEHIPKIYQGIYRKAMRGRSIRAAVNAKCQDCCNWLREEVKHCAVPCCPLYPYRPYSKVKSGARKHSPEATLEKNSDLFATVGAEQK